MARPSGSGCAEHASGCTHSSPNRSSGMAANTGEAAAAGYTDEKASCWKPGSVSGSVRTAPPAVAGASSTVTGRPGGRSRMAAASPFGPAPITTAAGPSMSGDSQRELVQQREPLESPVAGIAAEDLPPERVLGVLAGHRVGLLDMPGHRIPGTGRPHPRRVVLQVEQQPVVPGAHEMPLVGGQVEPDQGRGALGDRTRLVVAVAGEAVLQGGEPGGEPVWVVG